MRLGSRGSALAWVSIIAAVVLSAAILVSTSDRPVVTETIKVTVDKTITQTQSVDVQPNGSLFLSKVWNSWTFTVLVNSTTIRVGSGFTVSGRLTYTGDNNITIAESNPIIGVDIYNSTGNLAWAYQPPSVILPNVTVAPGEMLGSPVCVPVTSSPLSSAQQNRCSEFAFQQNPQPGQYSLRVQPNFFRSAVGNYNSPENPDLGFNLWISTNLTIS
jgi:hypothetical protein